MCGLVGIARTSPVTSRDWLRAGSEELRHRGPDDAGEWWSEDGHVGLAHRRLAIVDLSELGHQPMQSRSGEISLVFNGEIYNYKILRDDLLKRGYTFVSNSDTEVLLSAYQEWGNEFLARLDGMFAIGLYDSAKQLLLLARDRVGEKPLFYRTEQGGIRFASELKALLSDPAIPRRLNRGALDSYLGMGFVPKERCILDGFSKLPPAHALTFSLASGSVESWCYWSLPSASPIASSDTINEIDLLDELEVLLGQAVAAQLEADVPVGVLLSGGIDSSLIASLAHRKNSNIRTFCMSFPGQGVFDESVHARLIASHFGTQHTELQSGPISADILPILAVQFDEPIVDSSMIPTYFLTQKIREHCSVALGGDGGDELFGGYNHYERLLWMQQRLAFVPRPLKSILSTLAEALLPLGFKGRNYLFAMGRDLEKGLPLLARYFGPKERARLMRGSIECGEHAESCYESLIAEGEDIVQRATRTDFGTYLPEDILVKVDRASMLNSLEVRAPFLDRRVIEFAFERVPSSLKVTPQGRKIILRKLARRLLPPDFNANRKQGFSIPLKSWLREGPYRELFWDTLTSSACTFDPKTVGALLRDQDKGYDNGERLFALVQFELWRENYTVSF